MKRTCSNCSYWSAKTSKGRRWGPCSNPEVVIKILVSDGSEGYTKEFSSEAGNVQVSLPEDFGCVFFDVSTAAPMMAEHVKNMEAIEAFLLDVIRGRFPGRGVLAMRYDMSGQTINRYFKKYYNLTVEEWFLKQKLEMAAKMVVSGRPIDEVSFEFGFKGVGTFSRIFRRHMGIPLTQWK